MAAVYVHRSSLHTEYAVNDVIVVSILNDNTQISCDAFDLTFGESPKLKQHLI